MGRIRHLFAGLSLYECDSGSIYKYGSYLCCDVQIRVLGVVSGVSAPIVAASPRGLPVRFFDQEQFREVLVGARAGEAWAQEAIFDRYYKDITARAARKGVDDPEGLANLVIARVLAKIDSFAGHHPGEFTNYVSTTTARETHRALTVQHRQRRCDERFIGRAVAEGADIAVVGCDWVIEALAPLSQAQREVIELRVIDDLSIDETSQRLGRSTSSVRSLQHRGLLSLRHQHGRP